jgi:hypothetical protein
MDASFEKRPKEKKRQRCRVPFNHFARVDSGVNGENSANPHHSVPNSGANSTLVEDEFQFDRHLQEQWDKAISEGIHVRDTGVTFKACMRTF